MAIITALNLSVAFFAFVLYRYSRYYRLVQKAGYAPGRRTWIRSSTLLSETLPKIKTFNINLPSYNLYQRPFEAAKEFGATITTSMSYLQSSRIVYYVSDLEAVQILTTSKSVSKPLAMYKVLSFFGTNIVIVDGELHRRHRKVVAPAFSEANNAFVWDVTLKTCDSWFEDIDARIEAGDKVSTVEPDVVLSTMRAALMIISAAAFGMDIPWNDEGIQAPKGHKLIFRQALQDVLLYTIARVLAPRWLYKIPYLPKQLHVTLAKTETAYTELEQYLTELVQERQKDVKNDSVQRKDLLSLLLNGASQTNGLTEEEVKGNVYIFLLAGHETTAHTLAFAFALLALYPEEQEKIYQESLEVFPDGAEAPNYTAFSQLVCALACFHETLRIFPPVPHVPKHINEDMVLPAHHVSPEGKVGERFQMVVPAGSEAMIDARSLHHNPSVWGEDCKEFKPARFVDTEDYHWNRDGFLPFSAGTRSCVGQRFAIVEGACILSKICRKYTLSLPDEDLRAYKAGEETFEQLKARTLTMTQRITLTPSYKALKFTRRE